MARKHIAEMTPAEAAAQREKWRVQKSAQRQRAQQERQTPAPDAWQAAEREAEEMRRRAQEEMERARRETERERKAAERRAKHAAAERARRARLKSLTPKERELLQKARRWGLTGITSANVKAFKAYLDTRESQRQLSFHYEELVEASKDFDALIKARRDPSAIMADFAEYQNDVINMVESVRADLTHTKQILYSANAYDDAWSRYVEDVQDEMRYNNRQNKRKRG